MSQIGFINESDNECLSIALMIIKKGTWLLVDTRNKKILGRRKKKHRQMLKGKLDTSTKEYRSNGCVVDLNNITKIIKRKIVEYFNCLTKQISYEKKKVILNGILIYQLIKDIIDIDDKRKYNKHTS